MKLLLVDDDAELLEIVRDNLQSEGYIVDTASDGRTGSYMARTNHYDLIILDYSMPEKNGAVVTMELRNANILTPILFLSVIDDIDKKVNVLNGGADDFLQKPFVQQELSARIRAILRRPPTIKQNIISAAGIIIDMARQTVIQDGSPLYLTRKEYNLLEYLVKNKDTILSRSMIMEHVWNAESDPFSNTVEAHITNLRKKIQQN
ncbi:MAG: response regulator transcription factor, partial [Patescibacteria group bacterium]|nr:response regulator transcription factor [Patescibacteria group bacterium]